MAQPGANIPLPGGPPPPLPPRENSSPRPTLQRSSLQFSTPPLASDTSPQSPSQTRPSPGPATSLHPSGANTLRGSSGLNSPRTTHQPSSLGTTHSQQASQASTEQLHTGGSVPCLFYFNAQQKFPFQYTTRVKYLKLILLSQHQQKFWTLLLL